MRMSSKISERKYRACLLIPLFQACAAGLETLELQDNQLTVVTAAELAKSLRRPDCPLLELDISWNSLRASGVCAIAEALSSNSKLQRLRISWNGANQKGGVALAEALRVNSGLRRLDIQHNEIDGIAALMIADTLRHSNSHLTSLDLSHNPIGRSACEAVMAALSQNNALIEIGLQAKVQQSLTAFPLLPFEASFLHAQAIDVGLVSDDPRLDLVTAFDASNPAGEYTLDLSKPWERFIAQKLQRLAITRQEPWKVAFVT